MNGLLDAAFARPRTVLVALAAILIAGMIAYVEIPKEAEPDVTIPTIYVSMAHQGISPEDAARLLVKPMEQELKGLEGMTEIRATAGQGYANVVLEFEAGFDPDRALDEVRNRVDRARPELPDETDEPHVQEVNVALFPVLIVNLYGDVAERTLVRLARDLKDELEGQSGVLEADIGGDREEQIELIIDPTRLETYGLSLEEVYNAVSRNNQLVPAGAVTTGSGRFPLKVPGVIDDPDEFLNLAIKESEGRVVTVDDVAEVRRTFRDPQGFARLNGQPTLALEVTKRLGANIIETNEAVREATERLRENWPDAVRVAYTQDRSEDVRTMLSDLQNNVLSGVLLVMIVIVGILGLRAGTLVGVAIPGSFLLGILVLSAMSLTVNIVVLFSLILALGLLVDAAIVVVELADRYQAEGQPRTQAYKHAAQRMAWPIISSTLTTLAAFAPLLVWPGVIGEFMRYMPITLIAVLSASLLMALVFVPNLGAAVGGAPPSGGERAWRPGDSLTGYTGAYVRVLQRMLNHAGKVALGAVVALVGSVVLYANVGKGVEFFPDIEPDNAVVQIRGRGSLSVEEIDRLVRKVESRVVGMDAFESVYARSGLQFREGTADDVIGQVRLAFEDWETRPPAAEVLAEVRSRVADIPGVAIEVREQEQGPQEGKPVVLELSGPSLAELAPAAEWVRKGMREVGGFTDVTDSRPTPGLEWRLQVDRGEAARYGADIASIGQAVQLVTQGIKVGEYQAADAEDELDIRVRYPRAHRDLDALSDLRVQTADGMAPVSNFVTRVPGQKVDLIHRTDGRQTVSVEADVAHGRLVAAQLAELRDWVAENRADADLDPRLGVTFKGEDEDLREAESFLSKAFLAAIALIAMILLTQFNSFYQAFLILSAVVFSTIGVLLGLIVTGRPFGVVMSGIGVIALAGIVVNNNIILIDTYNLIRAEGRGYLDAVLQTGAERLRPVILTTVTTVLGLMPMVLGLNINLFAREVSIGAPSTQWWTQLSTAVVGGLLFATVLTLIVTPCLLVLGARTHDWLAARRGARTEGG
ncbi:efflux RND transporter permease subunit [Salinisphaera sp. P385]|uniref:Efflux RND transporter permease subunit n=1 Tax=Spectribacter acetivorans TaxID=3075603 RepID=A0ABU3B3Z5_9GAMM|nr:efflux RND transporter permease subunit [Salinisphaera sp. P385]MDT0617183.1 efflux RND transporter permease subunit [Salinisphaera sp. P385]